MAHMMIELAFGYVVVDVRLELPQNCMPELELPQNRCNYLHYVIN